jgi:hypothetical protein
MVDERIWKEVNLTLQKEPFRLPFFFFFFFVSPTPTLRNRSKFVRIQLPT